MKKLIDYTPPTKEEIEAMKKEQYQSCFFNENELSFWFPKIQKLKHESILIPETCIIPISYKWFCWLMSDNYKAEEKKAFSQYIKKQLTKTDFLIRRELFMKTGLFSNKFQFKQAHLEDGVQDDIGERYLEIAYAGLCVGCPMSKDLVLREFIHTAYERPTIYDGMKLNTEFRVFYSFDKKSVEKIVNYWDTATMLTHLYREEDKKAFLSVSESIEREFHARAAELSRICCQVLPEVPLYGTWSIDFMWTGQKYALIDMALAKESYYYNKK